ncbi:uncharacterized protein LOC121990784 [Zingiber officinale]|uniref:Uncharacterized protein n=1 Tax=Zingiber officinale TaxID=94328 RepID=A0A8J5FZE4_ZINOF|nr:uncharacterized protein LOC121990784 [Zingiber officinale]KAG6495059.1 hypothetical protein ZIOFF_042850 [Zingiber officinale]
MGSCFSSSSSFAAAAVAADGGSEHHRYSLTAKVITADGFLLEYPAETKVRDALSGQRISNSFICSSDELYCNAKIPALAAADPLRPGHLYFLLPLSKLQYPLSGSDMAALAVRASVALSAYASGSSKPPRKGARRVMPVAAELAGKRAALNEAVNEKEFGFYTDFDGGDERYYGSNSPYEKKEKKMPATKQRKFRQWQLNYRERLSTIEEIVE